MPRGDKGAYTDNQKRQAAHIQDSYEENGVSHEEAWESAWRTVNKQDGGGKANDRSAAARKGRETRRRKGNA